MSKPTLYYALFSPPARTCMITAKLIGLDLDLKFVDFSQKQHLSEEFIKLNPQHQIPVFVDTDGEVYIDSHAIVCFMVSKYGKDDKLYPKDLSKRARVDHRLHYENGVLFQVIKDIVARNIYGGEGDFNPKTIELCQNAYSFLEAFLKQGQYVVGNDMTVADISINTTLITLHMLLPVDAVRFPLITAWMELMKSLPDYEDVNVKGAEALCTRIKGVMAETKANSTFRLASKPRLTRFRAKPHLKIRIFPYKLKAFCSEVSTKVRLKPFKFHNFTYFYHCATMKNKENGKMPKIKK